MGSEFRDSSPAVLASTGLNWFSISGSRSRLAPAPKIPSKSSPHCSGSEQGQTIPGPKTVQETEDRGQVHRAPEEVEQGSGEQDHQLAAAFDGERAEFERVEEGA